MKKLLITLFFIGAGVAPCLGAVREDEENENFWVQLTQGAGALTDAVDNIMQRRIQKLAALEEEIDALELQIQAVECDEERRYLVERKAKFELQRDRLQAQDDEPILSSMYPEYVTKGHGDIRN